MLWAKADTSCCNIVLWVLAPATQQDGQMLCQPFQRRQKVMEAADIARQSVTLNVESLESAESSPMQYNNSW